MLHEVAQACPEFSGRYPLKQRLAWGLTVGVGIITNKASLLVHI